MLPLERHHDFQLFVAPQDQQTCAINPPSFNWPQKTYQHKYRLELIQEESENQWLWVQVSSPFQPSFLLTQGTYRWRITDENQQVSPWMHFTIAPETEAYLPPTAKELFRLCEKRNQFMMYFDEDIETVSTASSAAYHTLITTAEAVDIEAVKYPTHYRRGEEEGKRTAITNVRNWIDRDLMALTLLYKIWQEQDSGQQAVQLLLRLAEWSPEGPASLLQPCTWGDEVGLSLARNLYLAYHWLSPLLTESEKAFIRPMLVRIASQMEQRLEQDQFTQYPGHSHTSRLPAYLGIAALVLHKEHSGTECERWLNYALMIYRGVLPFYGGADGSWAEGAFYSSSYSKWFHPFFLAVERLSGFSFYNHPFYKNYCLFAYDFVTHNDAIHPFGDGFWCQRDSKEWPGFFAQNPLRIYADRFGNAQIQKTNREMENNILCYQLHLLDVIPTIPQLSYANNAAPNQPESSSSEELYHKFYSFGGFGKVMQGKQALYYRASPFGNSSHRHADQGNFALIDNGLNILTPTGSYGYRYGSGHHSQWTRTTKAHNLPLFNGIGQRLDNETATASMIYQQSGDGWYVTQLDLSRSYDSTDHYIRTLIYLTGYGLIVCDNIALRSAMKMQWRLHSALQVQPLSDGVQLTKGEKSYQVNLLTHPDTQAAISQGYDDDNSHSEKVISDASDEIYHLEWELPASNKHLVVASCLQKKLSYKLSAQQIEIQLMTGNIVVSFYSDHIVS